MFERLLEQQPYSLKQSEKEPLLLEGLNELTRYHYEKSPEYARILDAAWGGLRTYGSIADVPWLPVSLFKEMELKSTDVARDGHALERHHGPANRAASSSTTRRRGVSRKPWWRRFAPSLEAAACRSWRSTPRT